jgi:hypothetical protein
MNLELCDVCGLPIKESEHRKKEVDNYLEKESKEYSPFPLLSFDLMFGETKKKHNLNSVCENCRSSAAKWFVEWIKHRKQEVGKLQFPDKI